MAKGRSPAAAPSPVKKAAATGKSRLRLREDSSSAEMKQVHMKHLRAPSVKYDALFLKETRAGKMQRLYKSLQKKFQDRIYSLTKNKKAGDVSSEKKIRKYEQKQEENDAELAVVEHEYAKIKKQKIRKYEQKQEENDAELAVVEHEYAKIKKEKIRKYEQKQKENDAELAVVEREYVKIKKEKREIRKDLVLLLKAYKKKFRESVDIKVTSVDMLMVLRKLMEWVNFKPKWTISEVRRPDDTQPGPIQVMQQLLQLPNCISTLEGCTTATPAFSTRMSTSASASASASAANDVASASTSNNPPKP